MRYKVGTSLHRQKREASLYWTQEGIEGISVPGQTSIVFSFFQTFFNIWRVPTNVVELAYDLPPKELSPCLW